MDAAAQVLATEIGARLRQERHRRGWTLDRLADLAGVSRRMIVNVEQGAVNPSVGTLLRIGGALGIGLPTLVAPADRRDVRVVRSGDGAVLWQGEQGGRGVLLAGTEPPDVVELWDWTLQPGDRRSSEAHAPGTKELLQVRSGTLTVEVGEEEVRLEAGDAVAFPGDVPHAYANRDTAAATFCLAVHEPTPARQGRDDV